MLNVFPKRTILPGLRVRPQDDVPGFNIDDNGLPRRENTWPDEMLQGSATPQYPASAQALTPIQPAASSSLFDLLNRGPYGTPINPIRAYTTTNQGQWPSFNTPNPPADLDIRYSPVAAQSAGPQPASQEAMRGAWPTSEGRAVCASRLCRPTRFIGHRKHVAAD